MSKMQKEFVSYELAVKLKAIGFNEPCFGYYDGNHNFNYMFEGKPENFSYKKFPLGHSVGWTSAPTFSQAFRWFREKYKLHNGIYPYYDEYEFQIKDFRLPTNQPINGGLMPYEEAELTCLIKLIELVEQKEIR